MNKTKKTALNTKNSRILHETMVTLGALKEGSDALQEIPINEIQVHLLDEEGEGVILCLEYDEQTGELNKTFSTSEEYYEEGGTDDGDGIEGDTPHYYGEHTYEELDSCVSPENIKEFLKERIEETISEEYDEIFQECSDGKKTPLLN